MTDSATRAAQLGLTDLGNARRFARHHAPWLRYCFDVARWLAFDGRRYAWDNGRNVTVAAQQMVDAILNEALATIDAADKRAVMAWAVLSQSEKRLAAMAQLARSQHNMAVELEELDRDPMLLNVENGTVNLTTGRLQDHQTTDLITKLAPIQWDANASCPRWIAAVQRWCQGDGELEGYLQTAAGYTATGSTSEQVLFFLSGPGANGKSIFETMLLQIFGDYGARAEFSTFLAGRSGPRNDLAALVNARLVAASEAGDGRRLDEALVKSVTGGDSITCRRLYGEPFTFRPAFKLWLAANEKPEVRSTGEAMWRRIRLIPFNAVIPPAQRDPGLLDRLWLERAGILNWIVDGALRWQTLGLSTALQVRTATESYRDESDVLGGFLADCCELTPGTKENSSVLFQRYREWATSSGEPAISLAAFGRRLEERGFRFVKSNGRKYRIGLQIKRPTTEGTVPAPGDTQGHPNPPFTREREGLEKLREIGPELSAKGQFVEIPTNEVAV